MKPKIEAYKTAFSPMYDCFVGIVKVSYDDVGNPIIHAYLDGEKSEILFRESELTRFCL
jgi:hypothetical protein